ncbi:MAG: polymer-forming cytoskeletal protein [Deltaproteobacteria bacterium]|nr:polymer-forming cytoskeletal protein [Deltaproteobacteria bacterium]
MTHHNIDSGKQTFVEEGTEFKGTMTSSCPVAVRGTLNGDIKAPMLTITETGTVIGNVEAASIRSEGVLAGKVDAEDIFLSGKVRDNTVIRAKSLEVKISQEKSKLEVTFGECMLEVGEDPAKDAKGGDQRNAGVKTDSSSSADEDEDDDEMAA